MSTKSKRRCRRALVAVAACATMVTGSVARSATITEFPFPGAGPTELVWGPDGKIWTATLSDKLFLNPRSGSSPAQLAIVDTATGTAEYLDVLPPNPGGYYPFDLAIGPDNAIWSVWEERILTGVGIRRLVRVDPQTRSVETRGIYDPRQGACPAPIYPTALAADPQSLWLIGQTEQFHPGPNDCLVVDSSTNWQRIDPAGGPPLATFAASPSVPTFDTSIGPDGRIWIASGTDGLNALDPATGLLAHVPGTGEWASTGTQTATANGITLQGNRIWWTDTGSVFESGKEAVRRMDLATGAMSSIPASNPNAINGASDGPVFFTDGPTLMRVDPETLQTIGYAFPSPEGRIGTSLIAPDGDVWILGRWSDVFVDTDRGKASLFRFDLDANVASSFGTDTIAALGVPAVVACRSACSANVTAALVVPGGAGVQTATSGVQQSNGRVRPTRRIPLGVRRLPKRNERLRTTVIRLSRQRQALLRRQKRARIEVSIQRRLSSGRVVTTRQVFVVKQLRRR